ncbi:MAG: hypothetical protein WCB11_12310 [Terriglobales bacterium]|jgi:hypothetical protein
MRPSFSLPSSFAGGLARSSHVPTLEDAPSKLGFSYSVSDNFATGSPNDI